MAAVVAFAFATLDFEACRSTFHHDPAHVTRDDRGATCDLLLDLEVELGEPRDFVLQARRLVLALATVGGTKHRVAGSFAGVHCSRCQSSREISSRSMLISEECRAHARSDA